MPYRVRNKKTGHVYTVGIVADDEEQLDGVDATVSDGGAFRPPVYGDEAKAESSEANSKKKGA